MFGVCVLLSALLPALQVSAPAQPLPVLTGENLAAWRDHLLPRPDELLWESIPWHPSLASGLAAARETRKPLLLWAMNGHPLGCT